jgi:hypothetical protein
MNALFVFAPARFSIDRPIEWMRADKPIEWIKPGELVLEPGIYRFAAGTHVISMMRGGVGDAIISPVPADKTHWPDPPLVAQVVDVLKIPAADVTTFFAGTGVAVKLP